LARDPLIFFATDIHGSDRCFRKFLNAGKFYGVDAIVLGGDITGKMIVPVVEESAGRYCAQLFGRKRVVDADGLAGLNKFIADAGFYPQPMTIEEISVLKDDPAGVSDLFRKLISATMTQWIELAQERLAGSRIQCLIAPGNDDPFFVDDVLGSSPVVVNPDGRLVELPGGFPMISVGYSNRTPWDSPRELDEEDLAALIDSEVAKLDDPSRAIFNLHVPPKDTPIDQAVALDSEFRPVMRGGSPYITGVGSSAVRDAIATYQPMLSLHGHIHESRGEARIGRSLALNPGSEYSEGVLRGVIITLSERKGVRGYQLVAG
jgi:Icc-related predicted phosphoesterase